MWLLCQSTSYSDPQAHFTQYSLNLHIQIPYLLTFCFLLISTHHVVFLLLKTTVTLMFSCSNVSLAVGLISSLQRHLGGFIFISLPSILYLWICLVPLICNYMFIYLFCCSLFLSISSIKFYRRLYIIDQYISSSSQSACYLVTLSNYLVNHLVIFAVICVLF